MTDVYYVALIAAFFALCVGYVRACDRMVSTRAEADREPAEPRR